MSVNQKYVVHVPKATALLHYRTDPFTGVISKRIVDYSKMRVSNELLRNEKERLRTLDSFPHSFLAIRLEIARNGMYYYGMSDEVKCIFCQGVLKEWEVNQSVRRRHRINFPTCPFIINLNVGNVPNISEFVKDPCIDCPVEKNPPIKVIANPTPDDLFAYMKPYSETWRSASKKNKAESLEDEYSIYIIQKGYVDYFKCYKCRKELRKCPGFEQLDRRCFHNNDCVTLFDYDYQISLPEIFNAASSEMCEIEFSVTDDEIKARLDNLLAVKAVRDFDNNDKLLRLVTRRLRNFGSDYESVYEVLCDLSNPDLENGGNPKKTEMFGAQVVGFQCVICLTYTVDVLFLPCGHMKTCSRCSVTLTTCPICRAPIIRRVRNIRLRGS